jgi:pyruvate/2-oxoglutarate dehydrogenase complex dihydrolipoamide acyltransferase (E2) component
MLTSKNIKFKEIIPFDLQRKVVAHMTSSSWKSVPLVAYNYEPDITDFIAAFKTLSERNLQSTADPFKLTFNTIMLKAVVEGLKAAPKLNSLLEFNARTVNGRLLVCEDINISLPWLLPDGKMITPIIMKADQLSLQGIGKSIAELDKKIKNTNIDEMLYRSVRADTLGEVKRLNPRMFSRVYSSLLGHQRLQHLRGADKRKYYSLPENQRLTEKDIMDGTVTLSNIGSLYREQQGGFSLLEVVPPQVLAVGIGAIQEKPGVYLDNSRNKQIGIRKVLPICLAFDHRAVDFSTLVPFLKRMDAIFAEPEEIYRW